MDKKGINIEDRDYSLDRNGLHRSTVFRPAQRAHRFSLLQTLLLLVLSAAASGTAAASPLSAATILGNFNAVIYKNGSTSSDVEGAAVIGGNFSGATLYNQSSRLPKNLPSGFGALNVYGSTSGNAINIDNGGNAYVGGTTGATINFNGGGGYLTSAPGPTLSDFQKPLNKLSQSLAALSATASLPKPTNNETVTASPGSNGIAVFNLTSADLSKIPSFSIDLNGASTAVFNVRGSSPSFQANQSNPTTVAPNVIWNFYNATSLNLNSRIGGTVLAPNAAVSNGNQVDGVLVAKSWTGKGELHNYGFTGALPTASATGTSTAVPEPGGLAVFGAGLLLLGWLARSGATAQRHATC